MKFSKIIYFLYWCCSDFTLQSAQLDEKNVCKNIEKKIEILKSIANHGIWSENINYVNIILNEKIITVVQSLALVEKSYRLNNTKKLNTNNNQLSNYNTACKLCEQKLLHLSKSMYTALECKYSDLILQLLQLYFLNNKYNFYDLKIYVVKMMYNLLAFIKDYPNLEFANQDLLLSLISIQIYLTKKDEIDKVKNEYNNDENSINDNKLEIARMINLIERSRCENCLTLDNDYKLYDTTDSDYQLNNLSEALEKYTDRLAFEGQYSFNEEMYNTVNMTLEYIFQISPDIQTLSVKWNNTYMKFQKIAHEVNKSFYIIDVLDYQMLFIDVLKSIFCLRFLKMDSLSALQNELNTFDSFINQIIPINYPLNLFNLILLIRKSVKNYINREPSEPIEIKQKRNLKKYVKDKFNKHKQNNEYKESLTLSEETKQILNENNIIFLDENVSHGFIERINMSDLIIRVVKYKYFNIFFQIFTLFLNTPKYILASYNFMTVKNLLDINNLSFNKDICKKLPPLRENFFLFRSMIVSALARHNVKETNGPQSSLLSSMEAIKRNLAFVNTNFSSHYNEIRNIFIPITIYFKDVKYSFLKYMIVKQYLLLTINLLESYEIKNCHSNDNPITFNLVMFKQLLNDKNMYRIDVSKNVKSLVNFDINYLNKRIIDNIILYEHFNVVVNGEVDSYSLSWVDKFIPNNYFNYYDEEFNSGNVFWNGIEKHISNVTLSITEGVIDIYHLVRYQILSLKLMIYYVFKKMLYITHHFNRVLSDNATILSNIQEILKMFSLLSFPSIINVDVKITIKNYMEIFQNNIEDKTSIIEESKSYIKEQLIKLIIIKTEDTDESFFESTIFNLERVQNSLLIDFKFTSKLLNLIEKSEIIPK